MLDNIDNDTKEILVGSMIGDSYVTKRQAGKYILYNYGIEHSSKSIRYLEWKHKMLNQLNPTKIYRRLHHDGNINGRRIDRDMCNFNINNKELCLQLLSIFYDEVSNRKHITPEIISMMTPTSIAVWYMDDGSYNISSNNIYLATCSYTLGEQHLISNMIQDMTGAAVSITKRTVDNYYILYLPKIESIKFLTAIDRYIPESTGMRYKIPLGYDMVRKLKPTDRNHIASSRISDIESRRLIIDNLLKFSSKIDVTNGFPIVMYYYSDGCYPSSTLSRIFGSTKAALAAAGLPTNII